MLERWRNAEEYTLDVLETMPEGELGYAPFANEFSFAAHLTHLGYFNVYLLTAITRHGPPSQMTSLMGRWAEPRAVTKSSVRDYLRITFEEVRNIVQRLTPADLMRTGIRPGEEFVSVHTGDELVGRALTHTFHHRAQAIVYLRGKGLKPPRYRF
jgi:uncharacterized damage-inducible protein DinB